MTESATNFATKALKLAEERTEKTRKILRRNRLAYLGLHGMAFDQAKAGAEKLRTDRETFFNSLVEKGEEMEKGAIKIFRGAQDKVEGIADKGYDVVWPTLPGAKVNRVEELEAEFAAAQKKLKDLTGKAKKKAKAVPAKAKKAKKQVVETAKEAAKPVVKTAEAAATTVKEALKETAKDAVKTGTETAAKAASATQAVKTEAKVAAAPKAAPAKAEQPRHLPYFNDVKRYDPLASEDIVRKIVNHCGIALQSEDARLVACSDEAERNRVRDSWLKKKLDVQGTDAELDKKVQNVCSIMQRDNRKNRVTFYYLAAKAERKLEAI